MVDEGHDFQPAVVLVLVPPILHPLRLPEPGDGEHHRYLFQTNVAVEQAMVALHGPHDIAPDHAHQHEMDTSRLFGLLNELVYVSDGSVVDVEVEMRISGSDDVEYMDMPGFGAWCAASIGVTTMASRS